MERLSREEMLMQVARVMSQRSTCQRAKVGAVLSIEGRIISSGYGGTPKGVPHCTTVNCRVGGDPCRRTIHAEANAIAWAARSGVSTLGSTLHTTLSPCMDCAKLLINAGIARVVYDQAYRDLEPMGLLSTLGIEVEEYAFA